MVFGNKKSKEILAKKATKVVEETPDLVIEEEAPQTVGMMGFTEDKIAPAPAQAPEPAQVPAPVQAPVQAPAQAPEPAQVPAPVQAPAPAETKDVYLVKSTELIPETREFVSTIISTRTLGEVGKTYSID